jgi:hypothetical protein
MQRLSSHPIPSHPNMQRAFLGEAVGRTEPWSNCKRCPIHPACAITRPVILRSIAVAVKRGLRGLGIDVDILEMRTIQLALLRRAEVAVE